MDGCTFWFDGWWRSCCDRHDEVYTNGPVELSDHIELGLCVVQSAPNPVAAIAGVLIGGVMTAATTIWWLHRHKNRRGQARR